MQTEYKEELFFTRCALLMSHLQNVYVSMHAYPTPLPVWLPACRVHDCPVPCLPVPLPTSPAAYQSRCLPAPLPLTLLLPTCPTAFLSHYLPILFPACPATCLSHCLSLFRCLPIPLPSELSLCLPVPLPPCLSACLCLYRCLSAPVSACPLVSLSHFSLPPSLFRRPIPHCPSAVLLIPPTPFCHPAGTLIN
jgi:hypothetical protein